MNIWKKTPDLMALNAANEGRANGVLGIRITEVGGDFVRGEMHVEQCTHQPFGLLHGGVSCVLAETLGSVGAMLACDEDHYAVGVEINATHMNGVRSGKLIATARPLKIGKRLQTWGIDIESEQGRSICAARLTTAILPNVRADE
ncbi:MAG: hotdog fold thioesterase [Oceanococcus sp.]